MTASTRTADDYETLRAAMLKAEPVRGPDIGMVRRHGLTSWLKAPAIGPISRQPAAGQIRMPGAGVDPSPPMTELARLIAGIVVGLAMEPTRE
jgi:hypothetical protein